MTETAYLDHAATTPMRQCAVDALVEYAGLVNPASQYASGRKANAVLQDARETIATLLGADPVEVIFTGSGTEADNIAVRGLFAQNASNGKGSGKVGGKAGGDGGAGNRVVCSTIEHPAVLESVRELEKAGAEVAWLEATIDGHVTDLSPLDEPAAVAALMWANNETGAIQPVAGADGAAARAAAQGTPLHVDAVQVVGKIPVDFHALGAATLAASAHKFGGPRGTGILLAKRSPAPLPVVVGGGQERGIRSGTVDVASAAATAAALQASCAEMQAEDTRLRAMRDDLIEWVTRNVEGARGTVRGASLSTHAHFLIPGANADALIMLLDQAGVEVSAGSACSAGVIQLSPVLEAMGVPAEEGMGALRVSLGRTVTDADIARLKRVLPDAVLRARLV